MIEVKIVAGSKSPHSEKPLVTYLLKYPRFIHSEMLTHRMLAKNSASSRAIPANKMIEEVDRYPVKPIAWQKKHKGMQGTEYFEDTSEVEFEWLKAKSNAVNSSFNLASMKATKQLSNRLLEPFQYIEVMVTGTEWENFFSLRCPRYELKSSYSTNYYRSKRDYLSQVGLLNKEENHDNWTQTDWLKINKSQAEIHIQQLAELMWDAYNEYDYKELEPGQWHLPLVTEDNIKKAMNMEVQGYGEFKTTLAKISTARAARGSYGKWEGKTMQDDLKLEEMLWNDGHYSPFEHACRIPTLDEIQNKSDFKYINEKKGRQSGWFSCYYRFMSYRYLIERELF